MTHARCAESLFACKSQCFMWNEKTLSFEKVEAAVLSAGKAKRSKTVGRFQVDKNIVSSSQPEMASTSQETASAKQPTTPPLEESKKTTYIPVIHIPANGDSPSDPDLIAIERVEKEPHNNLDQAKSRLKHVPDLNYYCGKGLFNWDHRGLYELAIPEKLVPEGFGGWEGCYLMYKCGDSDSGLPFNRYFVGNSDIRVGVYGDAFLFKINGPECDQSGEATFAKLGSEFLKSLREGTFATEILGTLSKE
ncbi:hypothetical protein BDR22DRAFT_821809 [Usnea florida]